jgi:hypothetical protein
MLLCRRIRLTESAQLFCDLPIYIKRTHKQRDCLYLRVTHPPTLNPLSSVDAFVPGIFPMRADCKRRSALLFSSKPSRPQLDSTTSKALSSTWVSPVELIDETFFVEFANKPRIDQLFYFESRNLRVLQRHQPLRVAQAFC